MRTHDHYFEVRTASGRRFVRGGRVADTPVLVARNRSVRAPRTSRSRSCGRSDLRLDRACRPIPYLKFNAVLHGGCWLTPEGEAAARLDAGDCFIVAGRPFVLSSAPGLPAVDASEVFSGSPFCATYGLGDDVALLGGSVAFSGADASHLLDLLPSSLVICNEADGAAMMGWLLDQLDREWREDRPGAQAACDDLLRLMFIQALREHLSTADVDTLGWLAGLKDPAVAAALKAIHAEPTRAWRLPEAGMLGARRYETTCGHGIQGSARRQAERPSAATSLYFPVNSEEL